LRAVLGDDSFDAGDVRFGNVVAKGIQQRKGFVLPLFQQRLQGAEEGVRGREIEFLVGMVLHCERKRTGVNEGSVGWHCGNEVIGSRADGFEGKRI
jgi:hypothetical protein